MSNDKNPRRIGPVFTYDLQAQGRRGGGFSPVTASFLGAASAFAMPYAFASSAAAQTAPQTGLETTAITGQAASPPVSVNAGTGLDAVGFAAPWLLAGALVLPLLWFLMRLTPPQPETVKFPGTRLLRDLTHKEETPDSLPLWHKLLRLGAVALAVAGLAGPLLDRDEPIGDEGPLLLVVDNDWAAARHWDKRAGTMQALIDSAESAGRPVLLLPTAPAADGAPVRLSAMMSAAEARETIKSWAPQPWPADRGAALEALSALEETMTAASVVWLSNGIDGAGTAALAQKLHSFGTLAVRTDAPQDKARLLIPPAASQGDLEIIVRRPHGDKAENMTLIASDEKGNPVDRRVLTLAEGESEARLNYDLPDELKKQIMRIDIEGESSAGATILLDGQWRHRPVGVLANAGRHAAPLGSDRHYIHAALEPYADLRAGTVDTLLQRELAVMILPDSVTLDRAARAKVDEWVRKGGTLLRFAGPRLLAQVETNGNAARQAVTGAESDHLLPVEIRAGNGQRGGAFAVGGPVPLAPFAAESPLHGITLPSGIVIETQVLAEPQGDIDSRTWARLEDGTPLITAENRGAGQVILVHTTATTEWSNLVLSGLFVDIMRTVVEQSAGVPGSPEGATTLPPWKVMDGFGRLREPSPAVGALSAEALRAGLIGPQTPPGIYGGDSGRRAYNLGGAVTAVAPLPALPSGATTGIYKDTTENDLTGPLLGAALALMMADMLIVLGSRRFRGLRQKPATGAVQKNMPPSP